MSFSLRRHWKAAVVALWLMCCRRRSLPQNLHSVSPLMGKLLQAAIKYQRQMEAEEAAAADFYSMVDALGQRASSSVGPVARVGSVLAQCGEVHRQLAMRRRDVSRALVESVILPLQSKAAIDHRSAQRLGKEYKKKCKGHVAEIKTAEKGLDRWARRSRKGPGAGGRGNFVAVSVGSVGVCVLFVCGLHAG